MQLASGSTSPAAFVLDGYADMLMSEAATSCPAMDGPCPSNRSERILTFVECPSDITSLCRCVRTEEQRLRQPIGWTSQGERCPVQAVLHNHHGGVRICGPAVGSVQQVSVVFGSFGRPISPARTSPQLGRQAFECTSVLLLEPLSASFLLFLFWT